MVLKKLQLPGEPPSMYLADFPAERASFGGALCLLSLLFPPSPVSHPPNFFTSLFSCLIVICKQYIYHIYLLTNQLLVALCALSFSQGCKEEGQVNVVLYCQSLSSVRLFATPWTVARQAPLSMGFSRQEYWSGLPFLQENLPNAGIEPWSPALKADSLPTA